MGGSMESDHEKMTQNASNSQKNVTRVRQYSEKNNGPFEVLIRKDNELLKPIKVCAYIHKHYGDKIIQTKVINTDKIRVECLDIATANKIPTDRNLTSKYKVYIPESRCEVLGMIKLTVEEDENELLNGFGKWKNSNIPQVNVLEVYRYTRKIAGEVNQDSNDSEHKTESVRVAFPGTLLPEYVNINGLLIKVREFIRNQRFCEKCHRYNHSAKYCLNKEKCKSCGSEQHKYENCEFKSNNKCVDCGGPHEPGSKDCEKRKYLEKKQNVREKILRKKTYAEMLRELTNNNADCGDKTDNNVMLTDLPPESSDDESTNENLQSTSTYIPGVKRQRWRSKEVTQNKKRKAHESSDKWPNLFKKPLDQPPKKPSANPPPGFKKHDAGTKAENDPIYMFLLSFVHKLEINPLFKDLIIQFLLPIAMQIISTVKNTISSSMMNGLITNVV